ncbi:phosphoadenosine phosphosulfate reductase domain-containing protein [Methanofollis fontis]|uniref:Phosphoadenosine phosphosulfate reductase n=1 Tax=Methanofollis fontis TaxID=2052832 RepID=A0A483CPW9_9EURY|nr:phosphoadenosine phosphosulfate reductase family protein [Methanofollis fontis]TAJ44735.1 phosphoadenosine phosphosulfate reductase [Methanofollis fontis]
MRPSYLGKIQLNWCDSCHTPVLGGECACGAKTRPVAITPPGDARPAFRADIDLVNAIFEEHFGAPLIPEGHCALMNKVPDPDRMEEIILGGSVVAAIRYLPDLERWDPLPRPSAARYLRPNKRYVIADDGAVDSIRTGKSLLAPGLVAIDDWVRAGDEVFILDRTGGCIGVGRAKVDAAAAREMERGQIVRTRKNTASDAVPGPASWDDAVRANTQILDTYEGASIDFIHKVRESHPGFPVNVSYSGGKDSLATLLLVHRALGPVPILYADTGLEFPETEENVRAVAEHYGLEVVRAETKDEFWEHFSREGPPAVNARWCCRVAKLEPVGRIIRERWGESLSFIGQRKYESLSRKNSPRIWRNRVVKSQVSAAPIQHWTALHVWLSIFREGVPYNVLYEQGLDRIGCFMCPSSDRAVLKRIKETYPSLWAEWEGRLRSWQEQNGLPPEWIDGDGWRRRESGTDEDDSYN